MQITPFSISGSLISISALIFGFFVFLKDPKRKLYQIWLLFNMSVFIWGVVSFLLGSFPYQGFSYWVWKLLTPFGALWIPLFFLHFVYEFCNLKKDKFLKFSYLINLAWMPLILTDYYFKEVGLRFHSIYYMVPVNPLFTIFTIWWFFLFAYSLYILIIESNRTRSLEMKHQIQYIFTGIVIGFVGGGSNFLIMHGADIYPWGNFGIIFYPMVMAYAMAKRQLMDIQIIIKKTIYYSFLAVLVSLIYSAAVFLCYLTFLVDQKTSLIFNLLGILVIAVTFKPLELLINRFLQKVFFKGTISQIAEAKEKLETELERRERLKSVGILAAGMAHEIKNPITAINTFVEYLPQKYDDPDFRDKFQKVVLSETKRIKQIVSDLLLFSKPQEPQKRITDLNQILKDTIDLLTSELIKHQIIVEWSLASVCKANVDPDQIKQAFLNIIMNAIDAMNDKPGKLTVRTSKEDNGIKVIVQDNGIGIPQDKLQHIFDPFFTGKEQGTGLGLAITHSIVEKNKGTIQVSSEVGVGTTFTLFFPANI